MNRMRTIGMALVAVLALSAAAAVVATAVEGPFWKVEGSRLLAGETRLLLPSATANFIFSSNIGILITCAGLRLPVANEMQIIGSSGANGGRSLERLEFTGCTVTGNGTGCDVESGLFVTNLLVTLLGYSTATRSGLVLVLFAPDSGTEITTLRFTGLGVGECKASSALWSGNLTGLARVNGQLLEVGKEPAETLHGEVNFSGNTKTIWIENGGTLDEIKSKFEWGGNAMKLTGTALLLIDLSSPVVWGVFTA